MPAPRPTSPTPRTAPVPAALLAAACLALLLAAGVQGQPVLERADGSELLLDAERLADLERSTLRATLNGQGRRFEGYRLPAVLAAAGVPSGDALRGAALAMVVVVEAADGYRVAFTLAELDPTLGAAHVLLADRVDGDALPAAHGPWRLVVAGDRRPSRWIRNIVRIRVAALP